MALSPPTALALALAMIAAIGALDYLTGDQLSFSVFYLMPVAVATWRLRLMAGLSMAGLSAGVWLGVDVVSRTTYSNPAIHLWNSLVRLGFFVIVAVLMEQVHVGYRWEAASARTDPLTGLANRRSFNEVAEVEIERARRHGRPVTLVVLDVDDFKRVNDLHGHDAGDDLLRALAAAMTSSLRTGDVVARFGGDEFVLLLPETGPAEAVAVVERIRRAAAAAATGDWSPDRFSLGAVTFLVPPPGVIEALRRVDAVMYGAKRAGKGVTRFDVVGARAGTPS